MELENIRLTPREAIIQQFNYLELGNKYPFRNLHKELKAREKMEEKIYNSIISDDSLDLHQKMEIIKLEHDKLIKDHYYDQFRIMNTEPLDNKNQRYQSMMNQFREKLERDPNFTSENQFYHIMTRKEFEESQERFYVPRGIEQLNLMYKQTDKDTKYEFISYHSEHLSELDYDFYYNLTIDYEPLISRARDYYRPKMNSEITLKDFLTDSTVPTPQTDEVRNNRINDIIIKLFDLVPQPMIHYVDTLYSKLPLNTATGYHNRNSIKLSSYAVETHPKEYTQHPTKRGYYHNAYHHFNRTFMHYTKENGLPFIINDNTTNEARKDINIFNVEYYMDKDPHLAKLIINKYNRFINEHPTTLFTRSHITPQEKLEYPKLRPIYAVDDRFINMELMVMFPIFVQSRNENSSMLYNFETLRGGCRQLYDIATHGKTLTDNQQKPFNYFLGIDWSKFDQLMPKWISQQFFTTFLPKLILVNIPYHPTFEYPMQKLSPDMDKTAKTATSIQSVLQTWFCNMTFISQLGYSYRRYDRGIPSGMFSTQFIDSYCNLYMIVDTLLDINFNEDDISKLFIKVLGDDNIIFAKWDNDQVDRFLDKLEENATHKYQMKINRTKSHRTTNITELEVLSYKIGKEGIPSKNTAKLLAGLLFPERKFKKEYAAYRAIAFAIASAGQDEQFYQLCKQYYEKYVDEAIPIDNNFKDYQFMKNLPQSILWLEEIRNQIDFSKFPTLQECKSFVKEWKGPLGYDSKWRKAHYMYPPDFDFNELSQDYGPTKTLFQYWKENKNNFKLPTFDLTRK